MPTPSSPHLPFLFLHLPSFQMQHQKGGGGGGSAACWSDKTHHNAPSMGMVAMKDKDEEEK